MMSPRQKLSAKVSARGLVLIGPSGTMTTRSQRGSVTPARASRVISSVSSTTSTMSLSSRGYVRRDSRPTSLPATSAS